ELRLLGQIADLVTSPDVSLPTVSEKILASIVEVIGARRAVVMQWDPAAHALVPLAALCDEDQLAINRSITDQVFHERRGILASDVTIDLRYAQDAKAPTVSASVICVPVGTDSHCEGVIYVDSDERDRFSLRDVSVLVAVGRLFYVTLRMARLYDHVESALARRIEMVGKSAAFRAVLEQAGRVAAYDAPILITGETGTGKELLAREIHARSHRSDGPFVALNCSAIPETLFESELFGHEKGAFTGAAQLARGKIEVASRGTLFLDEIGEMSLATQPKILHFLQDHVFYRVGGTRPIQSDVRVIAATNKDLGVMVEQGRFRADLLFRLNVVQLRLPPLRERPDDIPALVDHFVGRFSAETKRLVSGVTDEAVRRLMHYGWPGNIRELANCVERAILLSDRAILDVADFLLVGQTGGHLAQPSEIASEADATKPHPSSPGQSLTEVEREHILAALERNSWNQLRAAHELGIHRNTLRNKIREYGLKREKHP
ncbi:sigma-54-dependent Fis family transcriptional regulator, partial [Candidatus Sumerlaeota bacterium]|nr:sigma-54-dependent Fis family transcriptional regulator [Candidatus Sumerlaeota bacterium]